MHTTDDLLRLMRQLRDPETGCPWDVRQTFATIAPYTLEEAYEVADAIEREDMDDLREELGDLLLQVVFHAQMAAEASLFDYAEVVDTLAQKLIRRHPHVFAGVRIDSDDDLHAEWEAAKQRERQDKVPSPDASALDGVTQALPALLRAQKLQKKAARVGFDWPEAEPVYAKITEEIDEVRDAVANGSVADQEEEVGDLLFAVVNLARHLGVDSETALRRANAKFERLFTDLEARLRAQGERVDAQSLDTLEQLWQAVKQAASKPPTR
ncbi:MAG TPA: nucleoside triphosphate pyrophosphohydrolase [Gammaproteobacteria bacterium]|nr:nucleoside triphosphate pyrophosphohydrolase [Gammaproteobacteria bacterium]